MTVRRMMILFAGALAVMATIVILRAETTRVHYEISELERRGDVLARKVKHEQLALQRALAPAALMERVKEIRLAEPPGEADRPRGRTNWP
ncbi:MAG: hypothetical protein PVJ57_14930 [Phycisphaerae bacterium]|jgi:hypothetical protein